MDSTVWTALDTGAQRWRFRNLEEWVTQQARFFATQELAEAWLDDVEARFRGYVSKDPKRFWVDRPSRLCCLYRSGFDGMKPKYDPDRVTLVPITLVTTLEQALFRPED